MQRWTRVEGKNGWQGGRTPWTDPKDLYALGYTMLLYPSTVIFRVTRAIQEGVADLKAGRPMRGSGTPGQIFTVLPAIEGPRS
jgi:hypothetical protein